MQPYISIIIPLYNKETTIVDTLQYILSQSFADFEVVIVDDGSTDMSVQKVTEIRDKRIRLYLKQNGGPSSARNYGLEKAQGIYGYFIDADDCLLPDSLQLLYELTQKYKQHNFFVFNYINIINGYRTIFSDTYSNGIVRLPFLNEMICSLRPCPGSVAFKMSSMSSYRFNETYKRGEDEELFNRILRDNIIVASHVPIFEYNHNTQSSSNPLDEYYRDFICCLQPEGKTLFEKMRIYQLYLEAAALYPNVVDSIYGNKFKKPFYRILYSLIMRYGTLRWKFFKYFKLKYETIHCNNML